MAFVTKTIQTIYDNAVSYIESKTSQTTPAATRSYNKVLAGIISLIYGVLLKFATDRAKEVLTISASITGLTVIGNGREILRKDATAAQLTIDVNATVGTVINTSVIYVGDDNGVRYQPDAAATATALGVATISVTALTTGVIGNLTVAQTLKADRQVSGADQAAVVASVVTTATDQEEVEDYRRRLLADERTEGGGSNSADYRRWAELTPGVSRAYTYTGNPTYLQTGSGTVAAGERTIWIKADSSIDPDGVPTAPLLTLAETYIKTDQETGQANEALTCDGDSTRYVEAIFNTTFFVTISGLTVAAAIESDVKADIETALKTYFRSVEPYIEDLDFIEDKNDTISDPAIQSVIYDIVNQAGGYFSTATFNEGAGPLGTYTPIAGELVKLSDVGGVTYV